MHLVQIWSDEQAQMLLTAQAKLFLTAHAQQLAKSQFLMAYVVLAQLLRFPKVSISKAFAT